ncbi:MAG TPA: DinB family protein [Candidatus Limnocylindrales bacterium]|nr:DinB family protein [Candidatus Limnocylindrales bacterium]
MSKNNKVLENTIEHALSGEGAHVGSLGIFDGVDWKLAGRRPTHAPHSLFQLLNHLVYWQDWVVKWLDGVKPPIPKHASGSWPGNIGPANKQEWERTVKAFHKGLKALERGARSTDLLAKRGNKTGLEMLQAIASHDSYHIGQVTLLRQILGSWPPPSGGLTW